MINKKYISTTTQITTIYQPKKYINNKIIKKKENIIDLLHYLFQKRKSYLFQLLKGFILFSSNQFSSIKSQYIYLRTQFEKSLELINAVIEKNNQMRKIQGFINIKLFSKKNKKKQLTYLMRKIVKIQSIFNKINQIQGFNQIFLRAKKQKKKQNYYKIENPENIGSQQHYKPILEINQLNQHHQQKHQYRKNHILIKHQQKLQNQIDNYEENIYQNFIRNFHDQIQQNSTRNNKKYKIYQNEQSNKKNINPQKIQQKHFIRSKSQSKHIKTIKKYSETNQILNINNHPQQIYILTNQNKKKYTEPDYQIKIPITSLKVNIIQLALPTRKNSSLNRAETKKLMNYQKYQDSQIQKKNSFTDRKIYQKKLEDFQEYLNLRERVIEKKQKKIQMIQNLRVNSNRNKFNSLKFQRNQLQDSLEQDLQINCQYCDRFSPKKLYQLKSNRSKRNK